LNDKRQRGRPASADLRQRLFDAASSLIEETGVAAGVLNNPANGVAWLANRLHGFGEQLKAGEIILSGSFIRPIPARLGDSFSADFGSFVTVSCQFT
jgi:2-oxo-hept-3-ene-1,7-dioate hydratase